MGVPDRTKSKRAGADAASPPPAQLALGPVVALVVAAAGVGVLLSGLTSSPNANRTSAAYPLPVPRVEWNASDPQFLPKIAARREPVVITGSPCKVWTAFELWTDEYLDQFMPASLNNIRYVPQTNQHEFFPATEESWRHNASSRATHKTITGSLQDVFTAKSKGDIGYFSGPMSELGYVLLQDVEPLAPFEVRENSKRLSNSTAGHTVPVLWAGSAGAESSTHVDPPHNFHVMVRGSKVFTLYDPMAWPSLRPFPNSHIHYRQMKNSRSNTESSFQVVLQPGEVVYIPPFWPHHVETLATAVSVSVVSPSMEDVLFAAAVEVPIPEASDGPRELRCSIARDLLFGVALLQPGVEDAARYLDWILSTRFEGLAHRGAEAFAPLCNCQELPATQQQDILYAAKRVGKFLRRVPAGAREMLYGDYAERVIRWAFNGYPDTAPYFLSTCAKA